MKWCWLTANTVSEKVKEDAANLSPSVWQWKQHVAHFLWGNNGVSVWREASAFVHGEFLGSAPLPPLYPPPIFSRLAFPLEQLSLAASKSFKTQTGNESAGSWGRAPALNPASRGAKWRVSPAASGGGFRCEYQVRHTKVRERVTHLECGFPVLKSLKNTGPSVSPWWSSKPRKSRSDLWPVPPGFLLPTVDPRALSARVFGG